MQAKQADFAIITIREDEFKAIASRFKPTPQRPAEPLYTSGSIGSSGSLVRDTAILIQ